jgi:phosphatidylethanolamine-binding protein (PEBP) family uncharacterized protein
MEVTSPAVSKQGDIAKVYTCDGANESLPAKWAKAPKGTAELLVFATDFAYVNGVPHIDWAVGGLSPKLRGLAAGKLPPGAFVGRNSFGKKGYSICPGKGKAKTYAIVVLAVPQRLKLRPGFNAVAAHQRAVHSASVDGLLEFSYTRS